MITVGSGNLLDADVDALVNTVNCVGVMGKGIALQFKRRYPDMFAEYARACKRGDVQIGKMFVVPTAQLEGPRYIINFPTKKHWRAPSSLSYVSEGLVDLVKVLGDLDITSLAVPPLGAGNGGLDWGDVMPLIEKALAPMPRTLAFIYPPSAGTRPIAPPKNQKMTWGRAIVVALIGGYAHQRRASEPWEDLTGASHLEIQKLMYLAECFEPRLKLSFEQGRYGPYSDTVRAILQEMEGGYLSGFGDGSAQALAHEPISPTPAGSAELQKFLQTGSADRVQEVVSRVLEAIEGFEGPYGVELLASTHWVADKEKAVEPIQAAEAVRTWTQRKGRIFTDAHVTKALAKVLAQPGIRG